MLWPNKHIYGHALLAQPRSVRFRAQLVVNVKYLVICTRQGKARSGTARQLERQAE